MPEIFKMKLGRGKKVQKNASSGSSFLFLEYLTTVYRKA